MRLKLDELQKVVRRTIDDERMAERLREEISRVLGPVVITEGRLTDVVAQANDRLDVLERTGRLGHLAFQPALVTNFLGHGDPEIRKFAARVAPERHLTRLTNDKDPAVRSAAAKRMPLGAVSEMLRKFPKDDGVRVIYRQRKLSEGAPTGAALPKEGPEQHLHIHDEERLGDAGKQNEGPELSEQWYRDRAERFMNDYGQNIEYCWEELAARRYVSSVKATSGVELDEARLLKAIKKLIEEREDRAMERSSLKETLSWLRKQEERELMSEAFMPVISEETDPVQDLVESKLTPQGFIDEANKLFRVQEATMPASHKKYRLGEGSSKPTRVPVIGRLPHGRGFRAIDEQALDAYCKHWSERQAVQGEPLKLEWSTHPDEIGKVSFSVFLR